MVDTLSNKFAALATALANRIEENHTGLSASSAATLLTLMAKEAMSTTELARIVDRSQPATARLVDKLVSEGFINRQEKRGREIDLKLTTAGRRRATKLQKQRLQISASLLERLSPAERGVFDRMIDKLLENLAKTRAEARHICRFCDHGPCTGPACPVGRSIQETN